MHSFRKQDRNAAILFLCIIVLVKYTDFPISFFFDGINKTPLIQMFGC